jgi:hypothetical protein
MAKTQTPIAKPKDDRPSDETGCAHHWVIASPNGETSVGRCKVCGLEKDFPNSADDYLWERNVPKSRWTGRAETQSFGDGY